MSAIESICAQSRWLCAAQQGYFSYGTDELGWEDSVRTIDPSLGLLDGPYPTDPDLECSDSLTQWQRFEHFVRSINTTRSANQQYKVLYLTINGETLSEVKEREVGTYQWNNHWSQMRGDGTVQWADSDLSSQGTKQAEALSELWEDAFTEHGIALPEAFYCSPMRRCIQTFEITKRSMSPARAGGKAIVNRNLLAPCRVFKSGQRRPRKPIIKEDLRALYGVCKSDQRRTRSWISRNHPIFSIESHFTELDERWRADRRETKEDLIRRTIRLLDDVFDDDTSTFVSLTTHKEVAKAILRITGHARIPVVKGTVYPIFVVCEKRTG